MKKYCPQCKVNKNANLFYQVKNGLSSYCKECLKERTKTWNKKNRTKINIYRRKKYDKEKNKLYCAKYYSKNKLKVLKINKNYRDKNKDIINEKIRNFRKRPDVKEKIKIYNNKRYRDNINYKIKKCLSSRLRKFVFENVNKKNILELLDCDLFTFKLWIECQFDKKMSWQNYGKYWHIDHVIPCYYFDLNILKNQKKCFNWKNLRPLEKYENIQKSNIFDETLILEHYEMANIFENENYINLFE